MAASTTWQIQDPAKDADLANEINERFGFQPLVIGLLDPAPFYFYLVLEHGEQAVPVPLPESLDRAGLERAIEAGIRRFAPGVMRTLALFTPTPAPAGFMGGGPSGPGYTLLQESLREGFSLRETDLTSGPAPDDADLLLVVAPEDLDEKQQFAIDQFLMQGGTVVIAGSSFHVDLGGSAISARPQLTGFRGLARRPRCDLGAQLGAGPTEHAVPDPRATQPRGLYGRDPDPGLSLFPGRTRRWSQRGQRHYRQPRTDNHELVVADHGRRRGQCRA